MNDNVKKAIDARDKYLAANPHLQEAQDEIELKLAHLDHTGDRMALLGSLMEQKIIELKIALNRAKGLINVN